MGDPGGDCKRDSREQQSQPNAQSKRAMQNLPGTLFLTLTFGFGDHFGYRQRNPSGDNRDKHQKKRIAELVQADAFSSDEPGKHNSRYEAQHAVNDSRGKQNERSVDKALFVGVSRFQRAFLLPMMK
ncbi:hypothetical protein D3C71_1677300 [compost metagenome]